MGLSGLTTVAGAAARGVYHERGDTWKIKMNAFDGQVSYWDTVTMEKVFTHPLDVARLRETIRDDPKILDYGCGYGRTCAELVSLGYQNVTGLDTSEQMIARGHRQFPELDIRMHTYGMLPFPAETFDVCILFAVLTCVPSDSGQRALIVEMARVLRPGGILYISDYPIQDDRRNQARYLQFEQEYGTFGVFRLPEGVIVRHHDMKHIHELLAPFEPISEHFLKVPTMNDNIANIFQIFARKEEGETWKVGRKRKSGTGI